VTFEPRCARLCCQNARNLIEERPAGVIQIVKVVIVTEENSIDTTNGVYVECRLLQLEE
jgi:hypothetical protein